MDVTDPSIISPGFLTHAIPAWEAVLRMALAFMLGALMGLDREFKRKPVGLRPIAMVCIGACAFTLTTLEMGHLGVDRQGMSTIDASRVIQGIVGGIGFLGAGALIRSENGHVKGAATGAGIWVSGAVGLACGMGSYMLACLIAGFAILAQLTLGISRSEIRDDIKTDKEPELEEEEEWKG